MTEKKNHSNNRDHVTRVFTVPLSMLEIEGKNSIYTSSTLKPDKKEIINKAFIFHSQGKLSEAVKYYKYLMSQGSNDHRIYSNYGTIMRANGNLKEAEISTRKAIELKPNFATAHSNLGNILKDLRRFKEAEVSTRKAIEIKTDFVNAYYNLGLILRELNNLKEAEIFTRKAIELQPEYADAYSSLGYILRDLHNLEEAEISMRTAIKIKPDYAEAHYNLGIILKDLDKLDDAEISTRKAIKIKPDYAEAYYSLFLQYEEKNNLKKLNKALKEFNNKEIIKNELLLFRARLKFRNKEYIIAKELIDAISPEWIEKSISSQEIIFWSYKAFIEDKLGNYDIAYACFEKSQNNPIYKQFHKDIFFKYIDLYKKNILNREKSITRFNNSNEEYRIAFLIGFPRSGTTLLDTILRSHPDIEVLEEKPLISNIEILLEKKFNTRLDNIYSISEKNLIILRDEYLRLIKIHRQSKAKLTIDKMPLNTVSLPLINLLFPNAKIIFTHRNPYDTVLSCFQQSFEPNKGMANLVNLKSSSKMYNTVMNVWDLYKNNLYLDYITSKYEDLINDFENHIVKLIDFLELEWDDNIKNYRKTALARGRINTPSSSQVVQPLYKSSIQKWKNYEKYFKDCHQYLERWNAYFDY